VCGGVSCEDRIYLVKHRKLQLASNNLAFFAEEALDSLKCGEPVDGLVMERLEAYILETKEALREIGLCEGLNGD